MTSKDDMKAYKTKDHDSLRISLEEMFDSIKPAQTNPSQYITDLQTINADYLINNIETGKDMGCHFGWARDRLDKKEKQETEEHAFDNDYNTYVGSSSLGMDFTSPAQITHIRFIPRNANNMIVPGNSYLLLYYDNGWKEHKILYAEHNYLDFENVP